VRPLHNLTKKDATFEWTPACEAAFQELKCALTCTPILVAPSDDGQYVLDTDASDTALGAVLQQEQNEKLHVIGYASRTLTPAETRYCITRRELLGVIFGLKKYRQHLLGRPIIVRTDHATLAYLMKTPEPVGQPGRWLDLLSEYDITIQHQPSRVHGNSDALSRPPANGVRRRAVASVRRQLRRLRQYQPPVAPCWQTAPPRCRHCSAFLRVIHRLIGLPTYSSARSALTMHPTYWRCRYFWFRRVK